VGSNSHAANVILVSIWSVCVLARSSKIKHPLGGLIDLPRLVPAFSSKGFPFLKNDKNKTRKLKSNSASSKKNSNREISEVTLALETIGDFIKDSILVSAYDIFHSHLRKPEKFFKNKEIIFIDSGGYELGPDFDPTEPIHLFTPRKKFTLANYAEVLQELSGELPFAVANFDYGTKQRPLLEQITAGQKLFAKFPTFLTDFIIKPVGDQRYLDVDEIIRHVKKFRAFHILGIAEKDLGKDLIEKLKFVAKLRLAMDREDVSMPIHLWGGLDPIFTPLYFFAGAEIFDGISWLRYAYIDGVATYRDCYNVISEGIETSTDHMRALSLSHNLTFLRSQSTNFREFVIHGAKRFDMFGSRAAALEKAYRTMVTEISGIEGGS
jgi:hypothetical protein